MVNKKNVLKIEGDADRLETPRMTGYRNGMTSSRVIGRRLENLYEVPAETPRRINELLQVLDCRIDGGE